MGFKAHQHKFDIWDSKAKRLTKNLDQQDLALHADLLIRDDCYLIQHIDRRAYNRREMRHGDIVRHLNSTDTFIVAWEEGVYIFRNKNGRKGIYSEKDYEVVGNLFENR